MWCAKRPPGDPVAQLSAGLGERPALTQSLQTEETTLADMDPQWHRIVRHRGTTSPRRGPGSQPKPCRSPSSPKTPHDDFHGRYNFGGRRFIDMGTDR